MGGVIISGCDTIAVGDTVVGVTVTGVTVTGGDATTVVALLNPKSVEIDGEKYFHISVHCDRFKPRSRVRLKSCPVARG